MIVGFTGLAGAGKDTAAEVLVRQGWTQLAFATPIKDAARALYGFSERQLYGDQKEVPDPRWNMITPRHALQQLGTEHCRAINKDFFLVSMNQRIDAALASGSPGVVITDARFDNEAQLIIARGGIVIEITCPLLTNPGEHASEQGISKELIRETLVNPKLGKEELHARVVDLVKL